MRILLCFLFTYFFISACGNKDDVPGNILPREKMQSVLWSMITAGEFLNTYVLTKDSVDKVAESSKIYGEVFQVHHITKDEFDKSYLYYREHPDLMKAILDSLSKQQTFSAELLQKRNDSLQKKPILIEDTK